MEKQLLKEDEKTEDTSGDNQEQQDQQDSNATEINAAGNVLRPFNDILGNHVERLLGTRNGIEELELNIFSISSIVLLASRETEIDAFPHLPPPRYTEESLLEELAEMSIEEGNVLNSCINNMIEKGYIRLSDDDRIFSEKPTISMAQLFDRIFPNMPGLNLVAYLGQMIDEVQAERKTEAEASAQFNQMLEIQGVVANSDSGPVKTRKKKFSHLRLGDDTAPEKKIKRSRVIPVKPADIFSQIKTNNVILTSPRNKDNATLSDNKEKKDIVIDEKNTGIVEPISSDETVDAKTDESEYLETEKDKGLTEASDIQDVSDETNFDQDGFDPLDDHEIEDKILEFEEQLGLKCPLCKTGGIKASETAKGKQYYHCSNADCNFISWGKPYYFECPKCENHFLIEVTAGNGKSILKCPRATCTHWQKFPWDEGHSAEVSDYASDSFEDATKPRKKVRRVRRVVRRKR